jgi:hypothetical protein
MSNQQLPDGQCWVERQGRCTRCAEPLEVAFMVKDKVGIRWSSRPGDDDFFLCHQIRWVAVCDACTTLKEAEEDRERLACPGCGINLTVPRGALVKACSNACVQRAARKTKRLKKLFCAMCHVEFTSSRRDARYCSSACRQKAHRNDVSRMMR